MFVAEEVPALDLDSIPIALHATPWGWGWMGGGRARMGEGIGRCGEIVVV